MERDDVTSALPNLEVERLRWEVAHLARENSLLR